MRGGASKGKCGSGRRNERRGSKPSGEDKRQAWLRSREPGRRCRFAKEDSRISHPLRRRLQTAHSVRLRCFAAAVNMAQLSFMSSAIARDIVHDRRACTGCHQARDFGPMASGVTQRRRPNSAMIKLSPRRRSHASLRRKAGRVSSPYARYHLAASLPKRGRSLACPPLAKQLAWLAAIIGRRRGAG